MNLSIGIGVPLPSKKESGNSYPNLYETPDSFLLLKRDFNLKESIQSGPLKAILEEEPEDLIFASKNDLSICMPLQHQQ
jgi:hypothetical protein